MSLAHRARQDRRSSRSTRRARSTTHVPALPPRHRSSSIHCIDALAFMCEAHYIPRPMANKRTYSAAVMSAPLAEMRVEELPAPRLEPGSALVRVLYSEVCGTDVHLHHGRLSGVPYPIVPGHVSVGTIAELPAPIAD